MSEDISGEKDVREEIDKDPLTIIGKQINILGSLVSEIDDASIKREFSKLIFYVGVLIGLYINEKPGKKLTKNKESKHANN